MKATRKPADESSAIFTMTPAQYVVLDIETGHAPKKVIDATVARWKPPANMKDEEKIEVRRKEYAEKCKEKSALFDGAPIICVACRTDQVGAVFNGMNDAPYKISGVEVNSCGDENTMLREMREWLDASTNAETVLVGFNVIAFDLPKLRAAYVRHRLKLPVILQPKPLEALQPVIDVMRLFLKFFTTERHRDIMISLDEVIQRLNLPEYKARVNGSKVPNLHKRKKFKEILTYAAVDVVATWTAFLLLTSQDGSME